MSDVLAGSQDEGVEPDQEFSVVDQQSILTFVNHYLMRVGHLWADPELDFSIRLFVILLICLIVNVVLIRCAWTVYGERLSDTFMKQGSCSRETSQERETQEPSPKDLLGD